MIEEGGIVKVIVLIDQQPRNLIALYFVGQS